MQHACRACLMTGGASLAVIDSATLHTPGAACHHQGCLYYRCVPSLLRFCLTAEMRHAISCILERNNDSRGLSSYSAQPLMRSPAL